jgi:DNA processing protein
VDSPGSAGCHRMIREGWATLVTSGAEVLDALGDAGQLLKAQVAYDPSAAGPAATAPEPAAIGQFSDSQRKILAALEQPQTLDQLAAAAGLPIHVVQADLTMLQIRGAIVRQGATVSRRQTN